MPLANRKPAHPDALQQVSISNRLGFQVDILNLGARMCGLHVPARGAKTNVILRYENPEDYLSDPYYMGAIAGRVANRIGGARYFFEGREINLTENDSPHHLHGGHGGFHARLWEISEKSESSVTLRYRSADGEEGYPGVLEASVTYSLDGPALQLTLEAQAPRDTIVNMTPHPYFNLNGEGSTDNHTLRIAADTFTPVDSTLIPTGELQPVQGTGFDFRTRKTLGQARRWPCRQMISTQGFDHNFVLRSTQEKPGLAAELASGTSGIRMALFTTCPGLQFYGGQYLDGLFKPHAGVCLEPQYFPDAPNQAGFTCPVAGPGKPYREITRFCFSSV